MGRRSTLLQVALAATSILLVLLAFEIGFRVKAYYDDRELDAFGRLGTQPAIRDPNARLRTKNIIRLSPNPAIVYELLPGIQGRYKGAFVSINADGFRGPLVPKVRSGRSVRIAGVGDSVMFGFGVGEGEYYLHFLCEKLEDEHPGVPCEYLNSGVPGYNTVMEVETLEEKLLAYDPDLVLIEYVANDLDLPTFIRNRSPYLSLSRSYLAEYLYSSRKRWTHVPDDRLARPPREVPAEYRHMVGIDAYRRAMTELARVRDAHDLPVVVLSRLRFPEEIRAIIDELGFASVECGEAVERHLEALDRSMDDYLGSELTVSRKDPHPSPLGHRIIAGVVYDHLREAGLIDRLVRGD